MTMGGPSPLTQLLKVAGVAQQQLDLLLEIEVGLFVVECDSLALLPRGKSKHLRDYYCCGEWCSDLRPTHWNPKNVYIIVMIMLLGGGEVLVFSR